jgi:RHS repeat-associated protein
VTETDGSGNWRVAHTSCIGLCGEHRRKYAAGNVINDGINTYLYDAEGRMRAVQSKPISGGTSMTEYIYDAQGLHFYLADPLGTRRVQTDPTGAVEGQDASLPWGDGFTQTASDDPSTQHYAQLTFDPETGLDHAEARQYTPWMGRWTAPDPYNGSYDLMNPQSFNRYMYVNGNPLGYTDPSGLAGAGILTGVGGAPCKAFGITKLTSELNFDGLSLNPCNPIGSAIADGVILGAAAIDAWQTGASISSILSTSSDSWSSTPAGFTNGYGSVIGGIAASVGAAITIGCSIDSNSDLCGQTGWTGALIGGDAGKVVGDSIAVAGAIACFAGPEACLGYGIYTIANDLFSVFWDLFGPAQFTGSLLPRPSDLGGLGTAPIGIPNQNLSIIGILGQPSRSSVPTPGMNIQ